MENNNGESSLEKLKKRLYKIDDSFKRRNKREDFAAGGKQSLPSSWQADEEQEKKIKPFKPMKYIIFISLFFPILKVKSEQQNSGEEKFVLAIEIEEDVSFNCVVNDLFEE